MVAFNFIATLFLAISLAVASPINERLVGRDVSTTQVNSSYQKLTSDISSLRQSISSGGITRTEARRRMESIVSSASQTFRTSADCGPCYQSGVVGTTSRYASSVYQELSSLTQTVNTVYGADARQVLDPVTQLDGVFSDNLSRFSQNGVNIQSLIPTQTAQLFNQFGLSQTANIASTSRVGGSVGSGL